MFHILEDIIIFGLNISMSVLNIIHMGLNYNSETNKNFISSIIEELYKTSNEVVEDDSDTDSEEVDDLGLTSSVSGEEDDNDDNGSENNKENTENDDDDNNEDNNQDKADEDENDVNEDNSEEDEHSDEDDDNDNDNNEENNQYKENKNSFIENMFFFNIF